MSELRYTVPSKVYVDTEITDHINDLAGAGRDTQTVVQNSNDIGDLDTNKADKVSTPTATNFAGLDSSGNLIDSGRNPSHITDLESDKADKLTTSIENNFISFDNEGNLKDSGRNDSDFTHLENTKTDKVSSPTANAFAGLNSSGNLIELNRTFSDFENLENDKADKLTTAIENNFISFDDLGNLADSGKGISDFTDLESDKADKVSSPTANNFAGLNSSGNLIDSGRSPSDISNLENNKADKVSGGTTDNFVSLDANGNLLDSGYTDSNFTPISHVGTRGNSHNTVTTTEAGFMSSSDKTKLNGIDANANNYSLPTASSITLGGVIIGNGITISNGSISPTFGTSGGTVCEGNDSRLSDARTPTEHSYHSHSDINQALLESSSPTFHNLYLTGILEELGNDLAEYMKFAVSSEPGDVLVQTECGLSPSIMKGDKTVVGVHSDTFGNALGADQKEKKVPIGLTGRVKVKVKEPLEIGDLLISDSNGFATKAGFFHTWLKKGVIIGKVLEDKKDFAPSRVWALILNG